MNKKIPLALALCSTIIALPLQADEQHVWRGIAFGQSTDVNFSSNVLPEKIGVNDVTIAGKNWLRRILPTSRPPSPLRAAAEK